MSLRSRVAGFAVRPARGTNLAKFVEWAERSDAHLPPRSLMASLMGIALALPILRISTVPGSNDGLLDWKNDIDGSPVTMYRNKTTLDISVPGPATLPLLGLGLLALRRARRLVKR
ncbi:MYXO-CTERM sorting domain-containing protein [Candidatus Thiodictyon syntrophicum]|jgi:uncharacterized protein (TIGR03382 family)|uniref:Uncharacterized protein n=1 Tax=Candidatus Thiodictyon syntrophicum TaxID=1166950 RepID=A0A2K8U5V2_9GAMM|nr:MYXO-CTERM sorting domain-containing protein [Candidatus Thiodictyon syntrophicum]AUB80954.1 hypothetical protein THSYN_08335 [Candidatus Thiodictyon syntrophicum]